MNDTLLDKGIKYYWKIFFCIKPVSLDAEPSRDIFLQLLHVGTFFDYIPD